MQERFGALDGWRGLCALLVAVHHLPVLTHFAHSPFVLNSYLFVDFFFVLSGFVISHSFHRDGFIRRRFARLWPLHIVTLAAVVLIELAYLAAATFIGDLDRAPFEGRKSVASIFSNIFLVHALGFDPTHSWVTASWSISVEFYTYLVFAGLMMLRRYVVAAVCVAALGAAVVYLYAPDYMETSYQFGFFRCLYGFFVGSLIYRLRRGYNLGTGVEAAAVIVGVLFVATAGKSVLTMAAPLVFGLIVWVFSQESGRVSALLKTRVIAALGLWSYSIYMTHEVLITIMQGGLQVAGTRGFNPYIADPFFPRIIAGDIWIMDGVMAVYLLAVIAVSFVSYRLIEVPAGRWINKSPWRRRAAPDPIQP